MEHVLIEVALAIIGLCMGSFAGASVWRLRARQLKSDKKAGEKVDKAEFKRLNPLTAHSLTTDRSQCLHCGHQLAWYDLIPLFSWVGLRGKCRYCKAPIGYFEPTIEAATAIFFAASYAFWPTSLVTGIEISQFVIWLIAGVCLAILFAYDAKWFILPDSIVWPLVGLGILSTILYFVGTPYDLSTFEGVAGAIVILSGIYLILWLASKGRWIGFGDVKLGLALALLLHNWELAFVALFAANLVGCLFIIPGMVRGNIKRTTQVPFGPLLILGFLIAALFGQPLINWYSSFLV